MIHSFNTLIISVVAGIVCHYICKWLDRKKEKDNQPDKKD